MIHKAQTSHIGSNLSCIDIMTVLFDKLNIDKDLKPDRDRFVLSAGWKAATLYYFLADKGVIPVEDLETYCAPDSKYIGLAEPYVRGVEAAGGAMGHGLPMAVGMALAASRGGEDWMTYCLMSDGEVACGTTWESALIAAHQKLKNLCVIIDYNKIQAMGNVADVVGLEPLTDKWKSMGWSILEIDGHNFFQISAALDCARQSHRPFVIIANTVKGKGVKEFENKVEWHYRNIDKENYEKALKDIDNE